MRAFNEDLMGNSALSQLRIAKGTVDALWKRNLSRTPLILLEILECNRLNLQWRR